MSNSATIAQAEHSRRIPGFDRPHNTVRCREQPDYSDTVDSDNLLMLRAAYRALGDLTNQVARAELADEPFPRSSRSRVAMREASDLAQQLFVACNSVKIREADYWRTAKKRGL